MRLGSAYAGALLYFVLAAPLYGQGTPSNIVLIYINDQGWTGTSVQMDPAIPDSISDFYQTPRLEELASQGMKFSNAYSSAPVCSPSRAALQTGKSPARLQLTDVVSLGAGGNRFWDLYVGKPLSAPLVPISLPSEEVSIAERLQQAPGAYATALIGVWHLTIGGVINAIDQGYDLWSGGNGGAPPEEDPKDMFGITSQANDFIEQSVNLGQPFFVMLSHNAVHNPHEARPELVAAYEALPPGERHSDPTYAAMTDDLDTSLGMVLDKLVELGIENDTFVIYTSDHGAIALLGDDENDPLFSAKGSVYEGGIRVPLIVRGPGVQAGSVCTIPVVGHDLFVTITSLAGVSDPLPEGVEGTDLSPVLFNAGNLPDGMTSLERLFGENGELYFHFPHYINGGEAPRVPASAIRDGDFKLVRIYGESGQPDTLLLFDLSQSVEESADPDSVLNLADDLPAKAAELNDKLEQWIQATNASLAYDVTDNVQLEWDAGQVGDIAGGWRSTIDVDYLLRETWTLDQGTGEPTIVGIAHVLGNAFRFDGDDGMVRKFFHVSDPKFPDIFDADHSASFEFWLRTDALTGDQVVFESGDGLSGLSVTLGDADGDGVHDDVRLRILGDDGTHLTVTTALEPADDPTQEFMQLVAVFSDDPADRYAEIFINGQLRDHVEGVDGSIEINWDGFDEAGLGRIGGTGLGGDGGAGDLPFAGSNFLGDIALFRFNNDAIDGAEVLGRYLAVVGSIPGDADGDGVVGISDFLIVLGNWGPCPRPCPPTCPGDVDQDCEVGILDFLLVLGNWTR